MPYRRGIVGAWRAVKTRRFVSEHPLKLEPGGITGVAGALYVADYAKLLARDMLIRPQQWA